MPDELARLGRAQLIERIESLGRPRRLFLNDGLGDCAVPGCGKPPFALWVIGSRAMACCVAHDAVLTRRHAGGIGEVDLVSALGAEEAGP